MARKKTAPKQKKSAVQLRHKVLKHGEISFYLDIYEGKGKRRYEFLGLHTIPEKSASDKLANEATLRAAEAIRANRELQLINGIGDLDDGTNNNLLLSTQMEHYRVESLKLGQSDGRSHAIKSTIRHLKNWMGESNYNSFHLCELEYSSNNSATQEKRRKEAVSFCQDFIYYLTHEAPAFDNKGKQERRSKDGTKKALSKSTARLYYIAFSSALNLAIREGNLRMNPCKKVGDIYLKQLRSDSPERAYLTIDELRKLAETGMQNLEVKRAFMFSALTGLRISDIENLKWQNIKDGRLRLQMDKTRGNINNKLAEAAKKWLPRRGNAADTDNVFTLPTRAVITKDVRRWAKRAGLEKHVTFHVARHAYATIQLNLGTDLFTVSRLLGHKRISTTEIYAKLLDKAKDEAADRLDNI